MLHLDKSRTVHKFFTFTEKYTKALKQQEEDEEEEEDDEEGDDDKVKPTPKRGHDFLTQNHIGNPNGMKTTAMVYQEEWQRDAGSP